MRSVLYLVVAALILAECEYMWWTWPHRSQYSWNILLVLLLTGPFLWGLVQRRTLRRWEETGNMSAAAVLQQKRNDAAMLMMTYGIIFVVLSILTRSSQ